MNKSISDKGYTKNTLTLIEKLKTISEDRDFILGVLTYADNEEDRKTIADFIDNGEDVSYSTVSFLAFVLSKERENND